MPELLVGSNILKEFINGVIVSQSCVLREVSSHRALGVFSPPLTLLLEEEGSGKGTGYRAPYDGFPGMACKLLLSVSSADNDCLRLCSQLPSPPPRPLLLQPSPSSSIKFGFCSRKQLGQATSE